MPLTNIFTPASFLVALIAVVVTKLYGGSDTKAMFSLQQRQQSAVLITGASRGIGKTIANHLAFVGYTVFAGVRSDKSYEAMASEDGNKGRIIPVKLDVADDKSVAAAVKTVQDKCTALNVSFTGIINNAGINPEGEALGKIYATNKEPENVLADAATVTQVLDTNVVGCFRVTKAFMPLLLKQEGRILLVGSYFGTIAGALGLPHLAYEASKFAVEALADGLRRGCRKDDDLKHISVSLIKPGNIVTDMNEYAGETPAVAVSKDVLTALEAKRPAPRYYPGTVKGLPCKQLCDFFALFPTFITDSQV